MRARLTALWVVPLVIAVDQITKHVVLGSLVLGAPVEVLGSFFRLTFIYNRGAAFGIHLGSPAVHTVVSIGALAAVAWLYWSLPAGARLLHAALALVVGGAIGNIIDRLRFDQVIDFFDVGLGEAWRWPVFNVADSCVSVGVILLILGYRSVGADRADPGQGDPNRAASSQASGETSAGPAEPDPA